MSFVQTTEEGLNPSSKVGVRASRSEFIDRQSQVCKRLFLSLPICAWLIKELVPSSSS